MFNVLPFPLHSRVLVPLTAVNAYRAKVYCPRCTHRAEVQQSALYQSTGGGNHPH